MYVLGVVLGLPNREYSDVYVLGRGVVGLPNRECRDVYVLVGLLAYQTGHVGMCMSRGGGGGCRPTKQGM